MIENRAGGTTLWMLLFLAIALAMVATGLGWLLFGPPIV
jgi:hypothetical protein